jgi:hypothetical protein
MFRPTNPVNLSANTSAFSIFGGSASSWGAFAISALATFPDVRHHPENASKMAKVVGPSRMPNQLPGPNSCFLEPPSEIYGGIVGDVVRLNARAQWLLLHI